MTTCGASASIGSPPTPGPRSRGPATVSSTRCRRPGGAAGRATVPSRPAGRSTTPHDRPPNSPQRGRPDPPARLAAGAAAARLVGNDTLRLLDAAATQAMPRRRPPPPSSGLDGDLHDPGVPGIIADVPSQAEVRRGSTMPAPTYADPPPSTPRSRTLTVSRAPRRAPPDARVRQPRIALARDAGAPLVEASP